MVHKFFSGVLPRLDAPPGENLTAGEATHGASEVVCIESCRPRAKPHGNLVSTPRKYHDVVGPRDKRQAADGSSGGQRSTAGRC